MKKLLIISTVTLTSIACVAQQSEAVQKTFQEDPINHPLFPAFLVGLFGIVVTVLLVVVGIFLIQMIRFMKKQINPLSNVVARPLIKASSTPVKQKRLSGA